MDLEKKIRSFLVQTPRPAKIVVRTLEDEQHELGPAKGGVSWTGIARSIVALGPKSIEVYSESGKLERATRCDDDDEKPAAEVGIPPALSTDPETARLTHFANLLFRAQQFSTEVAFSKMVEVFEMVSEQWTATNSRLERVETAYRRTLQDQLQDEYERVAELRAEAEKGGTQSPLETLAEAFTGGMNAAKQTNGAAKS